jgi:beta-galactosidase/beta-glucuronidase
MADPAAPPAEEKLHRSALLTEWGANVTAENAWREYPRPQLVRDGASWRCLNGLWDYAITASDAKAPAAWEGSILVPFALESRLSGVQRLLRASEALWYRRTFDLEAVAAASGQRRFLRFEAVDYECEVWLNEALLGYHTGGFAPFSFEVTGQERRGSNTLQLRVRDPTDGTQLRGKQSPQAHGIFYTRCSGIWQTVWMETGVISA